MKPLFSLIIFIAIILVACTNNSNQTSTDNIEVTFTDHHHKSCANVDNFLASGEEIISDFDTMCSVMDLKIPHVVMKDEKLSALINEQIMRQFCKSEGSEIPCVGVEDVVRDFEQESQDQGFELSVSSEVITNANGYLALGYEFSAYGYGAAHPIKGYETTNFDTKTGKLILLEDCILPGTLQKVFTLAEAKRITENTVEDGTDNPNDFPVAIEEPFVLAEDFAFTAAGLTFYYDQYEIGPGMEGLVTVTIPYAELNGIMNPESLMGKWVAGK